VFIAVYLSIVCLYSPLDLAIFSVSQFIHNRYDPLERGSARRKAAAYTQNDTNAE
jgi:hypothetical protein